MKKNLPHGFTLIELLIVVAIIAILAAIAVPNFLEAQVRAKVSRVKADFRVFATSLEAYFSDNNNYPIGRPGKTGKDYNTLSYQCLADLTTPVAYMTSVAMPDPFRPKFKPGGSGSFEPFSYIYLCYSGTFGERNSSLWGFGMPKAWCMVSYGPDRTQQYPEWVPLWMAGLGTPVPLTTPYKDMMAMFYDPTNGTMSVGDIARFGGEIQAPPAAMK